MNTVDLDLPAECPEAQERECRMSAELYQNARQTMGELRDMMRETGISWDYISRQIDEARQSTSAVGKAFRQTDEYSTGIGKNLYDKPRNIW